MKRDKLTDANDRTYGGCQWGKGVEHEAPGEGDLCTAGWIHVYTHPLLAILLNPIHGNFKHPHLWECEVLGKHMTDRGLKEGWQKVKMTKRLRKPRITLTQKQRFAILCGKAVYKEERWNKWADKWLSGEDRSRIAASAASAHSAASAYAAAAYAASAVAYAAYAVYAAYDAASAVAYAAASAAYAASAAASAAAYIDLIAIAEEAMRGR